MPEFRARVLEISHPTRIERGLQNLFGQLEARRASVSTAELTAAFNWSPAESRRQQDVQEFLMVLRKSVDERAWEMFRGRMELQVLTCDGRLLKTTEEVFFDLQLVVAGCRDVEDSLREFREAARLEGSNQYRLDEGGLIDAWRRTKILQLPRVLELHLLRFTWKGDQLEKISTAFRYPESLDLSPYLSPRHRHEGPTRYELIAVLVHWGSGVGGHYWAFCRIDVRWKKFNDGAVSDVSLEHVLGSGVGGRALEPTAFMLAYARSDVLDEWALGLPVRAPMLIDSDDCGDVVERGRRGLHFDVPVARKSVEDGGGGGGGGDVSEVTPPSPSPSRAGTRSAQLPRVATARPLRRESSLPELRPVAAATTLKFSVLQAVCLDKAAQTVAPFVGALEEMRVGCELDPCQVYDRDMAVLDAEFGVVLVLDNVKERHAAGRLWGAGYRTLYAGRVQRSCYGQGGRWVFVFVFVVGARRPFRFLCLFEMSGRESLVAFVERECAVRRPITNLYETDRGFAFVRAVEGEPTSAWVICEAECEQLHAAEAFPVGMLIENFEGLGAEAFHLRASRKTKVTLKKGKESRSWVIADGTRVSDLLDAIGEDPGKCCEFAGERLVDVQRDTPLWARECERELILEEP
jgi:hypothetical protein